MARVDRIASVAVLLALCLTARANAALDPARMFNPQAESFLPPLGAQAPSVSIISASIFHERYVLADDDILFVNARAAVPSGSGLAIVSFQPPAVPSSFHPSESARTLATPGMPQTEPVDVPTAAPVSDPEAVAVPTQTSPARFGTYVPYTPSLTGGVASISAPARLGNVRFETAFGAMQHCGTTDEAAACAQSVSAGTAFNVRAGSRNLNVRLESGVSEVANQNAGIFPYVPLDPDAQAGLSSPNASSIFGQNLSAQLAIPVNQRITVGLQFDRTYYQGNAALTDTSAFQGLRDTYLGNLTYQLKGSSAITFSARQARYQDLLWPDLKSSQMRADLKFTVKF